MKCSLVLSGREAQYLSVKLPLENCFCVSNLFNRPESNWFWPSGLHSLQFFLVYSDFWSISLLYFTACMFENLTADTTQWIPSFFNSLSTLTAFELYPYSIYGLFLHHVASYHHEWGLSINKSQLLSLVCVHIIHEKLCGRTVVPQVRRDLNLV